MLMFSIFFLIQEVTGVFCLGMLVGWLLTRRHYKTRLQRQAKH